MTPIYLSADNPRWTPRTEADLQAGIDQGLVGESHYLDLKTVPATKGDNKEAPGIWRPLPLMAAR